MPEHPPPESLIQLFLGILLIRKKIILSFPDNSYMQSELQTIAVMRADFLCVFVECRGGKRDSYLLDNADKLQIVHFKHFSQSRQFFISFSYT